MELDPCATEVEFSMPLHFDLSQLMANLNAWPRPMVNDDNGSSGGSTENSPSSISSRYTSAETSVGTNNQCITSCSMDTGAYSIKYFLVVELYKVSKSKCLSTISQEIKISPTINGIINNYTDSDHRRVSELQTPRRAVLGDVTNTRTNINSAKPPMHPGKSSGMQSDTMSSNTQVKIITPMAKLAVPRVQAEAISRGSAAIIMDRTREASAGMANSTPEQFAVMRRIANENDVVIINEAAEFSPAYARLCTPSVSVPAVEENSNSMNATVTPRIIFAGSDGDENDNSIMNQSRLIEL